MNIRGEEEGSIGREGDALDGLGDGDDGEGLAGLEIEHGDGAGGDVGGVAVKAVGCDGEHVGLGPGGGNGADDGEGVRVDDGDGLVELGGDVEEMVDGVEDSLVGTDAVAEIDDVDDLAGGEIDDEDLVTVGSGLADTGVAIDGNKGGAAVERGGDLMAGDVVFGDDGDLFAAGGINEAEGAGELIGSNKDARGGGRRWLGDDGTSQHKGGQAGAAKRMTCGIDHDFGKVSRGAWKGLNGCGRRGSGRWS